MEIINATNAALKKAEDFFGRKFSKPRIKFNLRGCTAGCSLHPVGIRYNVKLANANKDEFLRTTVPHEVAHWVQDSLYTGTEPHGPEWRRIMIQVYQLPPKRCHRFDTTQTQTRKLKRYTYFCGCREHEVTSIIHNRMKKGRKRACRRCGRVLELAPPKRTLRPQEL